MTRGCIMSIYDKAVKKKMKRHGEKSGKILLHGADGKKAYICAFSDIII